jgi:hypothetical protein
MEMIELRKYRFGIFMVIALLAMVSVVSADLPSVVHGYVTQSGSEPSYFDVQIDSGGSGELLNGLHHYGWCSDSDPINLHYIYLNQHYDFHVESSLPYHTTIPGVNWQAVNYVINTYKGLDKYTLQRLIWSYDGPGPYSWGSPDMTAVTNARIATNAYLEAHPDWVPRCDQQQSYAVILKADGVVQQIFIELPVSCPDPGIPVPEFPTFALPAGMIIGLVGLVYFVKGRE